MDKKQFKLQTEHNRYVRSAIAGICKTILWTDLYVFAMWLILSIFARIESSATEQALVQAITKNTNSSTDSTGIIVVGFLIIICTVVYNWAIAREIVDKVKQHKKLIAVENEYFGIAPTKSSAAKASSNGSKPEIDNKDTDEYDAVDYDLL